MVNHQDFETHAVMVTPVIAQRWLNDCTYERQRRLRPGMVRFLAEAMRRGEFKTGQIEFCVLGKQRFLTDGQHRLHAIVASGIPQRMVTVERFVNTYDDVNDVYARTDRGSARTLVDSLGAFGQMDSEGFNNTQMTALGSAALYLGRGFQPRGYGLSYEVRAAELRAKIITDFTPEGHAFFSAIAGANKGFGRKLYSGAIVSVALVTLRYQPEKAEQFWHALAANDGLKVGDPKRTLWLFISENLVTRRGEMHYSRAVAGCWSADFEERQLLRIGVYDADKPIKIAGSPYDGTSVIRLFPDPSTYQLHEGVLAGIEEAE